VVASQPKDFCVNNPQITPQTLWPLARVEHLIAGLPIPPIALPSTAGGVVALSALAGLSVVYLYPWTGRPGVANPPNWDHIPGAHGSTPQAAGFAAQLADFTAVGARVIGISGQTSADQSEFSARLGLTFPLLSDHALRLARALDLPTFETGGTTYLSRMTLIVRDGRIMQTHFPVSDPAGHARDVLDQLKGETLNKL
jgi:peroxiredoxin